MAFLVHNASNSLLHFFSPFFFFSFPYSALVLNKSHTNALYITIHTKYPLFKNIWGKKKKIGLYNKTKSKYPYMYVRILYRMFCGVV